MRILIVGINYYPELTGIGKYTGEMAEWLATRGCEVRVVTAPPYYPAWKISRGYSRFLYKNETFKGVRVIRCPLWVPRRPTGFKRIIHLITFAVSSFPVVMLQSLIWRPDIVFVVEPPFFCAPAALLGRFLANGNSWLHIQDFELDAAFELGILKSRRIYMIAAKFEKWIINKFDRVSTISEKMLERLTEKGVAKDSGILFPNWMDSRVIYPDNVVSGYRDQLKIPHNHVVILYSGNLGKKQGLEVVVHLATELASRNDLHFVICGDGAAKGELQKLAAGAENIIFFPLQPSGKLNELLNMADIHILPQRADAEDLVMPSKLTNMMASGRPVIATARKGTQIDYVVKECGIVIEPGNMDAFVGAVTALANDRERRLQLGKKAREIAVNIWDKENILSTAFDGFC